MDANHRLSDLITITERLAELLHRENDALRNRRSKDVHDLLDEKATLSRVYETRFKALSDNPELIGEADLDIRERLQAAGIKVQELMDENAKLLKAAIEANRRVVELIADAVREQQPSAGVYGANGITSADGAAAAGQRVAFSLDQSL